jgi:hypothetical protein
MLLNIRCKIHKVHTHTDADVWVQTKEFRCYANCFDGQYRQQAQKYQEVRVKTALIRHLSVLSRTQHISCRWLFKYNLACIARAVPSGGKNKTPSVKSTSVSL